MLAMTRSLVVAVVLLPVAAAGQSTPNFSGTWTRVAPPLGPDEKYVEHLELQDSSLKVTADGSGPAVGAGYGFHDDRTYSIGAPTKTTKYEDGTIRTVAVTWDGPSLVFVRTTQEGANTTTTRDVWSLSDDGTKLTKSSETTSWRGTSRETRVFKRQ